MSDNNGNMGLNELVALDQWNGDVPWVPGHKLELRSSGGSHIRQDRRVTVAQKEYRSYVTGNRNVEISGESKLRTDYNMAVEVTDTDQLTVGGDADVKALERLMIGSGNITRSWTGPMTRMIGMEGVICGGGFAKYFLGSSVTLTTLCSGDVYGAGVHAAAARIHMSGKMGYRSAERAMWAGGMLLRNTATTVEPIADSRMMNKPNRMWMKAGRLLLASCPAFDILWGLATAPVMIGLAVFGLVKNWKKPPPPPKGPPRTHTRNAGVIVQSRTSDKSM